MTRTVREPRLIRGRNSHDEATPARSPVVGGDRSGFGRTDRCPGHDRHDYRHGDRRRRRRSWRERHHPRGESRHVGHLRHRCRWNVHGPLPDARHLQVEVNVSGFKKWVRDGIVLQVNQRARVDVSLEIGRLEETTTVVASTPLLRTDSSEVGTVIEERAIKELPLNGRNFATLVYLMPGITPGQAGENLSGASTFNPRGASNFNALGHQANANAWLIDGIDNNDTPSTPSSSRPRSSRCVNSRSSPASSPRSSAGRRRGVGRDQIG